jgi:4-coumarate--CoA ligase
VKGPTIIQGYFENDKANRESWDAEGYFKSGDVIQVDETGLMYVVERVKELIKVRGFQVAPAELEGVLISHPSIVDAAVLGIPGKDDSELPRAYLVRREGTNIQEAEVQAFMKEQLAGYKQLVGGVVFIDEIPKLPSGKILKRVLREMIKQESGKLGPKL